MGRTPRGFKHFAVRDNKPDDRVLQIQNGRQKRGDASVTGKVIFYSFNLMQAPPPSPVPLRAEKETINL